MTDNTGPLSTTKSGMNIQRTLVALLVAATGSACTPKFNRDGQQAAVVSTAAALSAPLRDMSTQGGSSVSGITPSFRVSRVVIGGDFQRRKGTTQSSSSVQGGPHVSRK